MKDGGIQISASGGSGSYHYSINGIDWQSSPVFSGLGSGSYPALVRNSDGTCRVNNGLTVLSEPNSPIITFINPKNPKDCGAQDGSITINTAGGTGSFEYSINGGNSWVTTNKFEQLSRGVFQVRVRNDNGTCEVTGGAIELKDPAAPQLVDVIVTDPTDCEGIDGKIEVDALAGATTVQYSLNDGLTWSSDNVFLGLSEGNYDLKLRNNDGSCIVDAGTSTLSDPPTPTISSISGSDPTDCNRTDGTISILAANGTGNYSFSIDNGATWKSFGAFPNLPGGSYAILVRNADGSCVTPVQNYDLVDPVPPVNNGFSALDPSNCADEDGVIEMDANSSTGVQYSIDGGNTWLNSGLFNDLPGGTFELAIRNADTTCVTSLGSIDLLAPSGIEIDRVYGEGVTDCGLNDGAIVINASYDGNSDLEYSIDNGQTWRDTSRFEGLAGGTYDVRVRTIDGTCAVSVPGTRVLEPTAPQVAEVLVADPSDCQKEDGRIFLVDPQNQLFETSIDAGNTFTMQKFYQDLSAGEYWVKVRNTDGTCVTDLGVKVLQEPPTPEIIEVTETQPSACMEKDGSIRLDVNFPGQVHTSIDGGLSWQNRTEFNNLPSGNYPLMIRNADRTCEVTGQTVALKGGSSTLVVTVTTQEADCGVSNGRIFFTISGQTSVVDYSIDGGLTWHEPNTFNNLPSGSYHVMARENYDCITDAGTVQVETSGQPVITDFQKTDPSHCLSPDGTITIAASGNLGTIQYSINGGLSWQGANQFNGLSNGNYQLMVRYDNGSCANEGPQVSMMSPGAPVVLDVLMEEPFCNNEDGSLTIQATPSINTTLEYSIDNGTTWQSEARFTDLAAGNYPIMVRNGDLSCPTQAGTVTLHSGSMPEVDNLIYENPDCIDNDGMIEVQLMQNLPGITEYSRNNGLSWQTAPNFENLSPGSFHIMVRNMSAGEWCTVDAGTMDLIRPSSPSVNISKANPSDCGIEDGRITINASGQFDLEYSIDGTIWQSNAVFENLPGGSYTAMARYTDGNCETIPFPITLSTPESPSIDRVFSQNPDCEGEGSLIAIATHGGTGDLEYSIDGGIQWTVDSLFYDVLPGTYDVMVRNGNGSCEVHGSSVTISQKERPVVTQIYPEIPDCDVANGSIEVQATITDAPLSMLQYSIDAGATWQNSRVFQNLDAGLFHIMVKRIDAPCDLDYGIYRLHGAEQPEIILIENNDPVSCDVLDGKIEILALGRNGLPDANLEYSIDGGVNWNANPQFLNLGGGTYQPMVRFEDGTCAVSSSDITLDTPASPERTSYEMSDPDCDRMNGSISLLASGNPNKTLEYSIDGGQSWTMNGAFAGLNEGNYQVYYRYTDGSCETFDTTLNLAPQNYPVYVDAMTNDPSACDAGDGSISINASGVAGLEYSINGVDWQVGATFNNVAPGSYNTMVRYQDGRCEVNGENITLELQNEVEITSVTTQELSDCNASDGAISIIAFGDDVLEYSINRTDWQSSPDFQNLGLELIYATGSIDEFECTVEETPVTIQALDPIEFDVVECCPHY
ncbi:MAG: SprB repeat-containing protein [Saprospiraceae bacterium]